MLREVEKENFTRGWDLRIIKLISHIHPLGDIHAKCSSNSNHSGSYSSTHYIQQFNSLYSYMAPFSSTYIVHKIRKTEAKTHCFNFLLKIGRQIKNRLGLEGEWCLLGIEQKFC